MMQAGLTKSFSKSARLRKSYQFRTVQESGAKFGMSAFAVVATASPVEESRLGLVVSKRVGNSVVRNRVKRVIREAYRLQVKGQLKGQLQAIDFVVIAKPNLALLSPSEFAPALSEAIRRAVSKLQSVRPLN